MNPGGVFEKRWRELGHGRFTLRLKSAAMNRLDELCRDLKCNRRDVLEGLLLGTIARPTLPGPVVRAMRDHGMSEAEARLFTGIGA